MFFRRKPKLTKEQQDNVVRWLVRGYDPITSVEFIHFSKDFKTGMFFLSFELNSDEKYRTTIFLKTMAEFDESEGVLGLGPVDQFDDLDRQTCLPEELNVDISQVNIIYL
ncbi:hypothetical protein [Streptococcus ferus]|uniref:hypothetical protein n=1 Tax=Streptococcus ferus TaxID=1345 RepID=UPI0035A17006